MMDDIYQYPIFFECDLLLSERKRKIETYFRVRRRSGGGDCGPVHSVNDNVYSISFKSQEDQQRVLQRCRHVVELTDGHLEFTIRDSLDPHTTLHTTTTSPHPQESPQPIPTSAPLPSCEEYELHLDCYLLRYLNECPKVEEDLEKKLASVSCSAQLYPEEGRVLVRRSAQPDDVDEGSNWKADVDRLFDGYLCHYEVDPHKVKALLQSCSSHQSTGEVKAYSEAGLTVVVGERSQVNALLLDDDDGSCLTEDLASMSLSEGNTTVASYSLQDGLQVLVCQGDITKQHADALVNAANEDLDHGGGVAAALCEAGGPEIQRESSVLVKYMGKIPTGDVVVTTGGNLNCQKLLHAVGPVGGKAGGMEGMLLEKAVHCALDLSEIMGFQSIAFPCITSGAFGIPVCSEAIVTAIRRFGSQRGRSLSTIILIDNREEVVKVMKEACDRLLQGRRTGNSTPGDWGFNVEDAGQDTARGGTAAGGPGGSVSVIQETIQETQQEHQQRAPGGSVHLEIVQGTIESQQVDSLVSPMVGHDPLSTRVGNILYSMVGPQLTAKFKQKVEDETMPGDAVLVEDLTGLQSNAVFFLNLVPWDDDENGIAVEVLRLGINNILNSCENRGFGSIALPVLGAGIALRFPESVVHEVLQEQVAAFEQERATNAPLLVRIVIHPDDEEANEAFKSVQEQSKCDVTEDTYQQEQDQGAVSKRIVLLGKTGSGKSNLANTIFGEELFTADHSPNSGTKICQSETKTVNGRSITLIDTPGFFDSGRPEEDLKPEIMSCITECAPGPHAFLIVLKVEKFSEQEQAVITKIRQYFSEDALKYAVIVFSHGEQLPKGMKIDEFVSQSESLSDLVSKCGGRCHVFDNKYWNNKQQNNYRSNQFQLEELLNTIDKMVLEQNGGYYTNEMLQNVEKEIQTEEETIRTASGNLTPEEIRREAKARVSDRLLLQLVGTATGALLGAFFGMAALVGLVITAWRNTELMKLVKKIPALTGPPAAAGAAAGAGEVAVVAGGVAVGVTVVGGAVAGGVIGYQAVEEAESPSEAFEMAAGAVADRGRSLLRQFKLPGAMN